MKFNISCVLFEIRCQEKGMYNETVFQRFDSKYV